MKKVIFNKKFVFVFLCFLVLMTLAGCIKQTEVIRVNKKYKDYPVALKGDIKVENVKLNEIQEEEGLEIDLPEQIKQNESNIKKEVIEIPSKLDLGVPFVSQAPLRDWGLPYKEACEEASMMSVAKYFNQTATDSQTINQELLALVKWEEENDYLIDMDAEEVAQILQDYFGLKAWLETEITADRIKYELAQGHPIIIPTSGRTLGNPYFRVPGPIYHMLVLRGYDSKNFITNDVGTNTKGEKFKYKYQTIIDSIHDWDHELAKGGMTDAEMAQGRKIMIVVSEF